MSEPGATPGFTPGPWTHTEDFSGTLCGEVWAANGERISVRSSQPDANLIAAAPDLYTALKQAVADAASSTSPRALMPNYVEAVAALQKAEGGQP